MREETTLSGRGWELLSPDMVRYDVVRAIDVAYAFFALPAGDKRRISDPVTMTGHRRYGVEHARTPERPDQMETFSISGAHLGSGPRFPLDSAESDGLYCVAVEALRALHRVAASLVCRHVQERAGLDVSQEWVEEHTLAGSFLQINSYTMSTNEPRPAQDSHEDANLVTLGTADAAGLEVRREDGGFEPARNVRGAHIAMVGGVLSDLMGGHPQPCHHRVVAADRVDRRVSLQLFLSPAPEAVLWPSVPGVVVDEILERSNASGLASGLPQHSGLVP